MSDYSKAVIYKLYCKDITVLEIYIGSTHNEKKRKKTHKSACNNENSENYNLNVYEFMRENCGYDNWIFEVIENYPCENETQLRIRERYHYDLLNPALNTYRPYVSEEEMKEEKKEYYQDNIEELKEYQKKYHENYYHDNIEEIKEQNKEYYENNREKFAKNGANYREQNREKFNQKYNCKCGGKYTYGDKARHCKSKRHKTFIEKNQNK